MIFNISRMKYLSKYNINEEIDEIPFYDNIELGPNSSKKFEIFRKLQHLADSRELELSKKDGLVDKNSKVVLVGPDSEDVLSNLFKVLDLDSLIEIPARNIQIKDIVTAIETRGNLNQVPDESKEYNLVVSMNPKKITDHTTKSILDLLNNVFDVIDCTISNVGNEKGKDLYIIRYKLFVPENISKLQITEVIQNNLDLLQKSGIKNIEVTE